MKFTSLLLKIQLLALLLTAFANITFAQNTRPDSARASIQFERARLCQATENYDSSLIYIKEAIAGFGAAEAWEGWVDAVNYQARVLNELGRTAENKVMLDSALARGHTLWGKEAIPVANTWLELGRTYYMPVLNRDSAYYCLKQALDIKTKLLGPEHTEVATAWVHIGRNYQNFSMFNEALVASQKALQIKIKILGPQNLEMADIYNDLGLIYDGLGQYEIAEMYMLKNFKILSDSLSAKHSDLGTINNNLATLYTKMGNFEKALIHLKEAIAIHQNANGRKNLELAISMSGLGVIYHSIGDDNKALAAFENAIRTMQQFSIKGKPHPQIAAVYNNLASLQWQFGDYEKALENLNRALEIYKSSFGNGDIGVARSKLNIGVLQTELGQYQKGLDNLLAAKEAYLPFVGNQHPIIAIILDNIGRAQIWNSNYADALKSIQAATEIQLLSLDQNHPDLAGSYLNMAHVNYYLKNYELAIQYNNKGIEIFKRKFGDKHAKLAKGYEGLMNAYNKSGELEIAMEYCQKAIVTSIGDFESTDPFDPIPLTKINSSVTLLRLFGMKASLYSGMASQTDSLSPKLLPAALQNWQLASDLIDTMRNEYSQGAKVHLAQIAQATYEGGIQTALELYRKDQLITHLQAAFRFAEKSKSILLMESLQDNKAKQFSGIPDSLLEKEQTINTRLSYYRQKLQQEEANTQPDSAMLALYKDYTFEFARQKEDLLDQFRRDFPEYYQLKYDLRIATLPEVQRYLPDSTTALIEYFYGDSNIYVFTITKDTAQLQSFPNNSEFQHQLSALNQHLHAPIDNGTSNLQNELNSYTESAFALYNKLLAPSLKTLIKKPNHLILIPDGPISYLPFDALVVTNSSGTALSSFQDLPYLIHDYKTSNTWSATIHFEQYLHPELNRALPAFQYDVLAFAPDYRLWPSDAPQDSTLTSTIDSTEWIVNRSAISFRSGKYKDLSGARNEAKELRALFGAEIHTDSSATEEHFRKWAPKARIIHIGAHGSLNFDYPEYSNIAFLPTAQGKAEADGYLHISEIYNLRLNAELIVLPVCNSNSGTNQKGEGLMTMARAFRYAGCENIIAGKWEVDDEAGKDVSINLYHNIQKGLPIGEALRQAKLKRLKEGGTDKSHPYYWAPMVLIGEDAIVKLGKGPSEKGFSLISTSLMLGAIGIVMFFLFQLYRNKSKNLVPIKM